VATSRPAVAGRLLTRLVCAAALSISAACGYVDTRGNPPAADPATVFTPAHESIGAAISDFFWIKPRPVQPIEFPHKTHIAKGLMCTEYCHESVTKGPIAGLPSVNTCMICHQAIATDRPLIKQITALSDKGLDLQWQRVYGYTHAAHVHFNHAPHIRANIDCSTCHGDIANQTVAQRNVDLHMGFCVNCHRQRNAPNECTTCHF
jgi:hypothetical protein